MSVLKRQGFLTQGKINYQQAFLKSKLQMRYRILMELQAVCIIGTYSGDAVSNFWPICN